MRLCRPRQWGACWLAGQLWRDLRLEQFWAERLPPNRRVKSRWDQVLHVLVSYRLIAPGCEWKLHRDWFGKSAMADLLGADFGLAEAHKLYACHDFLLQHKDALFSHLTARWCDLFNTNFGNSPGSAGGDQASRMSAISRTGSPVKVRSIFQPCFLAVESIERMTAKSFAPSFERKPPEIFCHSNFIIRPSCSARLLVKGTAGSLGKRSTSDLRVLRRSSRLWPTRRGGRPRRLASCQRGLCLVELQTCREDRVVTALDQCDQARRQRHTPLLARKVRRVAGSAQQALHLMRPILFLDLHQRL